jgi:hypothetical protein
MSTPVKVIVLPNGTRLRLGDYCQAWRRLKAQPPETEISGWEWYPVEARHILRRLREGVTDRINRRGGIVLREANPSRIHRQLARRIRHHCRWCGGPLGRYARLWERFCDEGCRSAHSGL